MAIIDVDDYAFQLGGYRYGFSDWHVNGGDWQSNFTKAELGPVGEFRIPVGSQAAWGLVVAVLILLVGTAGVAAARVAKQRANR